MLGPRDPGARARGLRRAGRRGHAALGRDAGEVFQFFSHGMLLNVVASLDLQAIADRTDWAQAWCEPGELIARSRPPA